MFEDENLKDIRRSLLDPQQETSKKEEREGVQSSPGKKSDALKQTRGTSGKTNQNEDSTDHCEESKEQSPCEIKPQGERLENAFPEQEPANQETRSKQFCSIAEIIINPFSALGSYSLLNLLYLFSIVAVIVEMVIYKEIPIILYLHLLLNHIAWGFIVFWRFGFKNLSKQVAKYQAGNPPYETFLKGSYPTMLAMTIIPIVVILILKRDTSSITATFFACLSLFLFSIVLVNNMRRRLYFYVETTELQAGDIISYLAKFDEESEERITGVFDNMSEHIKEINDGTNWIIPTRFIYLLYALPFVFTFVYPVEAIKELIDRRYDIISITILCYLLVEINLGCFRWKFSKSKENIQKELDGLERQLSRLCTLDPKKCLTQENKELLGNLEEIDVGKLEIQPEKLKALKITQTLMEAVLKNCQDNLPSKTTMKLFTEQLQRTAGIWEKTIVNIKRSNQKFLEVVNDAYKNIPEEIQSATLNKGVSALSKVKFTS